MSFQIQLIYDNRLHAAKARAVEASGRKDNSKRRFTPAGLGNSVANGSSKVVLG